MTTPDNRRPMGRLTVSLTLLAEGMLFIDHLFEPKFAIAYGILLVATVLGFVFLPSHHRSRRKRRPNRPVD